MQERVSERKKRKSKDNLNKIVFTLSFFVPSFCSLKGKAKGSFISVFLGESEPLPLLGNRLFASGGRSLYGRLLFYIAVCAPNSGNCA